MGDFLECPECLTPAIAASGRFGDRSAWCEEDEADCPGCGVRVRAYVTGDSEREWVEARVVGIEEDESE